MRKTIKTKSFNPPIAGSKKLSKQIISQVARMANEYIGYAKSGKLSSEILDELRVKYETLFTTYSEQWGYKLTDSAMKAADFQFQQSLKDMSSDYTLGKLEMPESIAQAFKLNVKENAELFKTIPEKFHSKVSQTVFDAITSGKGAEDITKYIRKFDNGTRNYVSLRTMDQTRKAFSALSRERMKAAGITKFKWIHTSGSAEPRKLHIDLNGKVFDINDPPYIGDMYGERVYGYPAQLPNCRCRQAFVFADI